MADYTVTVDFEVEASKGSFRFVPDSLNVYQSSPGVSTERTIEWVRGNYHSSTNSWKFKGISFLDNASLFSSKVVTDSSINVTDTDNTASSGTVSSRYEITVELAGTSYTSDPQIVNKGGTGT